MNRMIALLCLSMITILSPGITDAANLHAILVADTTDESIGSYTEIDLRLMKGEMQKIAANTGLDLKFTVLEGRSVLTQKFLKTLSGLKIEEDDTVVFYFSGHGYRTASKGESPWPNLFFSLENKGVEYELVVEKLEAYHPRFLLVISDSCNNVMADDYAPPLVRKWFPRIMTQELVKENYRHLFLNVKGVVMVTSSRAGQVSWATPWGGLFTIRLAANLNTEVRKSNGVSWQSILEKTYQDVQEEQNPDFRIDIEE